MSYEHLPFRVTLTKPDASTVSLTDRVVNDGIVQMDESCEEGIGELRHGDISLELDDTDGTISALFASVVPSDQYEVLVERRTSASDATWMKVFVGLLDFPWSVQINRKKKTVRFQVFSWSKVLEKTDASTVKRSFDATIIATVNSESDVVTLTTGTTSNIKRGDRIGIEGEEQTVETVDSSTQLTTYGTFREAHTKQPLSVLTPYHRNKSLAWLVDALFDAAGLSSNMVDMDYNMSTLPFLTGFSDDGIQTSDLEGLTSYSGNLAAWVAGKRYESTAPDAGFGSGTTQAAKADWTRYLAAEPAALRDGDTSLDVGYDHTNSYTYSLSMYYSGIQWKLDLLRNGSLLSNVDSYSDILEEFDGYPISSCDYDPVQNRVWVSYSDEIGATPTRKTKYYDVAGAAWTTVSTTLASLCSVAIESKMLAHEADAKVLRLYAVGTPSTGDPVLEYPDGDPQIKTFQVIGNYIAGIVRKGDFDYLCLWDKTNRDIELLASIGPYLLTPTPRITKWTYSSNETCVVAAGGALFILSRKFLGTIPYADFSDKSCQSALKDLAIAAGAYVYVDLSKVGKFVSRFSTTPIFNAARQTIGDIYERSERPIWSWYRDRVEVSGVAQDDGEEVKQIVGSNAYSSRDTSLSSDFIQNNSQANAIAQMYYTWLSQNRREFEVQVAEPAGLLLHILDKVSLDSNDCQVYRVQSDLKRRVQTLTVAKEV